MIFSTGEQFELLDPALGSPFATVQLSTSADVDAAVATAVRVAPQWRRFDWPERAAILRRTAATIRADVDRIAEVLTQEQGKTLKEARIEVERCAETFDYYADDRFAPRTEQREVHGKAAWVTPLPLGVVAAIVPWNFPLTLLANKLVPALAAGNTVIVKPAQTTPLATRILLDHLADEGLPEGVVNTVLGEAPVGQALVSHPDVAMISFTGSTAVGRAIMAGAAGRVKRLALELGGSDALIVDADADVAQAAKSAAVGRFFNCGQACIAVKRVFVHENVYDEFLDVLAARVDKLTIGDGRNPGIFVGPQHTDAQRQHTLGLIDDAVAKGSRVVRGGKVPADPELAAGFFVEPTVLADVPADAAILSDECFGPALAVVRVASFDEAIERANASEFGLGSSIWSRDPAHIRRAVEELQAGYTWVNDMSTDYETLPFGGMKQSGFGKERGAEGIEEYRFLKSVVGKEGQEVF
ncbi:aldehyde dehydrogenase family protein [Rhodococcus opacus]|uniref:aldehyde dehydrogenase family protein n=1 Tax=Rhodococcus opacus TaxID=37919 RepID=UPI002949581F|nr:aldehyde dehydrogenase family protein [Rhodococcus opacus]MDV6247036.1 aldehyde dehydrogenase family protein [Rhodococcus opacus]